MSGNRFRVYRGRDRGPMNPRTASTIGWGSMLRPSASRSSRRYSPAHTAMPPTRAAALAVVNKNPQDRLGTRDVSVPFRPATGIRRTLKAWLGGSRSARYIYLCGCPRVLTDWSVGTRHSQGLPKPWMIDYWRKYGWPAPPPQSVPPVRRIAVPMRSSRLDPARGGGAARAAV